MFKICNIICLGGRPLFYFFFFFFSIFFHWQDYTLFGGAGHFFCIGIFTCVCGSSSAIHACMPHLVSDIFFDFVARRLGEKVSLL